MGSYDLTTKDEVKAYLRISGSSEDTFIDKLIERATARIEKHTQRKLKARDLTEFYDGSGTDHLTLREYPINSLSEVNVDPNRDFAAGTALTLSDVVSSDEEGRITLGALSPAGPFASNTFPRGTKLIKVVYNAGFSTIPSDLEEACIKVVAAVYAQSREGADGIASESLGGRSVTWIDGLPAEIVQMLEPYVRNV